MDAYGNATTIATALGVTRQYISKLCAEGRIPSRREDSTTGGPQRLMVTHMDVAAFLLETGTLKVHDCACSQGAYQIGKAELGRQVQDLELGCETLRTELDFTRAKLADALKSKVPDTVPDTAPPPNPGAAAPPSTSSPPAPPVPPTSLEPTPKEREAAYWDELGQLIGIRGRPLTDEEKQRAWTLREKQGQNAGGLSRRFGLFGSRKG